jgi:hypothetical protein
MMTSLKFILTTSVIVVVTLWGAVTQDANAWTGSGSGYGRRATGGQTTTHPTIHPKYKHPAHTTK